LIRAPAPALVDGEPLAQFRAEHLDELAKSLFEISREFRRDLIASLCLIEARPSDPGEDLVQSALRLFPQLVRFRIEFLQQPGSIDQYETGQGAPLRFEPGNARLESVGLLPQILFRHQQGLVFEFALEKQFAHERNRPQPSCGEAQPSPHLLAERAG
jgi:hypothetical protein